MAEWEKEIAELRTDVKYIREDVNIMQKQIRDLNKTSNMGLGGLKVFLVIGTILGAIWTFIKITDWYKTKLPLWSRGTMVEQKYYGG